MPDYATSTNLIPSISSFGRFGFVDGVIDWLATSPAHLAAFFSSVAVVSLFNLLWALIVLVGSGVIYIVYLTAKLSRAEHAKFVALVLKTATPALSKRRAAAWHDVAKLMASESATDWKIAVLEADSILDQLLEDLGYKGESLGERLKGVPKGAIKNLQAAWEAHKVRNVIAHDTATARLPRREAEVTIGNFERVFREFDYI